MRFDKEKRRGKSDNFRNFLGMAITIGFYVTVIFIYKIAINPIINVNDRDVFNMIVGAIISSYLIIVNYYWGSSKDQTADREALIRSHQQSEKTQNQLLDSHQKLIDKIKTIAISPGEIKADKDNYV